MEFKFINPFSEEFLKDKEIDDNIKRQNSNDRDYNDLENQVLRRTEEISKNCDL